MKIWQLGENVDTDALAPGAVMQFGVETIAKHCLNRILPTFASEVRAGDVIVAGAGFGIGSSREQAAAVLVHLGVVAVIAPSFGGLFFRNAFNLGLLALVCPRALEIRPDLALHLYPEAGYLEQDGLRANLAATPAFLLEMVHTGGLMQVLKQRTRPAP
jgi:3-isopropylmalate/(R)-2-methylmalate dehydratase small subunit